MNYRAILIVLAMASTVQADPRPNPPLLGHKFYFGESVDGPWVWRVDLNWHEAQDLTFQSITARDGSNLVEYVTGTYSLQPPVVDEIYTTTLQFAPVALNGSPIEGGEPRTMFFDWAAFPAQLEMWGLAFDLGGVSSVQPSTTLFLIPEPATLLILLVALPFILRRRTR